jgi:F420H(2)-dependent quinone reductase
MSENSAPQWIIDHIKLYMEDPEAAHMWDSTPLGGPGILPTLLLTTSGRKSGDSRSLPLIYKEIDGNFVIIASKGGAASHPSWFLNLQSNAYCEIQVGPRHFKAQMRLATDSERGDMWAQMAELYPPYDDYQVKAGAREIPVVVLQPRSQEE